MFGCVLTTSSNWRHEALHQSVSQHNKGRKLHTHKCAECLYGDKLLDWCSTFTCHGESQLWHEAAGASWDEPTSRTQEGGGALTTPVDLFILFKTNHSNQMEQKSIQHNRQNKKTRPGLRPKPSGGQRTEQDVGLSCHLRWMSLFRIMCCERWTGVISGTERDVGDSCGGKMRQMERVENVWICFIAADNVVAAGQSSDYS